MLPLVVVLQILEDAHVRLQQGLRLHFGDLLRLLPLEELVLLELPPLAFVVLVFGVFWHPSQMPLLHACLLVVHGQQPDGPRARHAARAHDAAGQPVAGVEHHDLRELAGLEAAEEALLLLLLVLRHLLCRLPNSAGHRGPEVLQAHGLALEAPGVQADAAEAGLRAQGQDGAGQPLSCVQNDDLNFLPHVEEAPLLGSEEAELQRPRRPQPLVEALGGHVGHRLPGDLRELVAWKHTSLVCPPTGNHTPHEDRPWGQSCEGKAQAFGAVVHNRRVLPRRLPEGQHVAPQHADRVLAAIQEHAGVAVPVEGLDDSKLAGERGGGDDHSAADAHHISLAPRLGDQAHGRARRPFRRAEALLLALPRWGRGIRARGRRAARGLRARRAALLLPACAPPRRSAGCGAAAGNGGRRRRRGLVSLPLRRGRWQRRRRR
mmetsp:Transcript_102811/g.329760  ORF Transcript_102811/g.329760 Transcript_102811/m.329760 type:complete len:433 (+) Transcript_102811:806-2104(+)